MKGLLLAFYLGIQCCLFLPALPEPWIALVVIPFIILVKRHVVYQLLFTVLFGFFYAALYSSVLQKQTLPEAFSGQQFMATGSIVGMPEQTAWGQRFVFAIDRLQDMHGQQLEYQGRVRLSWSRVYHELHSGEKWRLKIKLKAPHGFANPGSFDYEYWLFRQRIHATAYVVESAQNQRVQNAAVGNVHNIRIGLNQRLDALTQNHPLRTLVKGLITGTRTDISEPQWQVLRQTGTSHLMAISGLHITLIAAGFYMLTLRLCRYLPFRSSFPVFQRYALVTSFIAACVYAVLAGFSLPTQRALIMLLVVYLAILFSRKISVSHILSLSGIIVLLYDPLAVRSAGFYLSFFAVGLILLGSLHRMRKARAFHESVRMQCALSLGLAPWVMFYFAAYPLLSLPANLLAIPVLSVFLLPGLLLVLCVSFLHWEMATVLMTLVMSVFDVLWLALEWMSGISMLQWQGVHFTLPVLMMLTVLTLLLLFPAFFQRRYLLCLAGLGVFLSTQTKPVQDELRLTVLDVGQGLSIVIQVGSYVLLYDAGPAYQNAINAGERVVVPFLLKNNITSIDDFIVSHQDNDHAGGAGAVLKQIRVNRLISDLTPAGSHVQRQRCKAGMHWQVEGARFEILHPKVSYKGNRNNRSCVLKVSYEGLTIMLPGDIEARAEQSLLTEFDQTLKADVLIAPHHGSASSSTIEFIQTLEPYWVIFSSGYQNRYKFPKQVIIERYENEAVNMLQTSDSGAISVVIRNHNIEFQRYRDKHRRFWHHSHHQQNSYCGEC